MENILPVILMFIVTAPGAPSDITVLDSSNLQWNTVVRMESLLGVVLVVGELVLLV